MRQWGKKSELYGSSNRECWSGSGKPDELSQILRISYASAISFGGSLVLSTYFRFVSTALTPISFRSLLGVDRKALATSSPPASVPGLEREANEEACLARQSPSKLRVRFYVNISLSGRRLVTLVCMIVRIHTTKAVKGIKSMYS
jgi:hypothetical protein